MGPALGGALADPCNSYPTVFQRDTIFDRFPYLLPNLVCAVIVICGVVIGILFLKETHEEKKYRRDIGLETGQWILSLIPSRARTYDDRSKVGDANLEETRSMLSEDEQPPGYRTTEGSPRPPRSRARSPGQSIDSRRSSSSKPSVSKAFTKQVVLNIIGYGILA